MTLEVVFTIGVSGSGKRFWALDNYPKDAVISCNDWFLDKGIEYDAAKVGLAHQWCIDKVIHLLEENKTVVVNNTNVRLQDMFPYIMALKYGNYPHTPVFKLFPNPKGGGETDTKKMKYMLKEMKKMGLPTVDKILAAGPGRSKKRMENSVLYAGIFFKKKEKQKIVNLFGAMVGKQYNLHVTIAFMPTKKYVTSLEIGKEVDVQITGYFEDNRIQIVTCETKDVQIENEIPHITVSTLNMPPVASNYVLKYGAKSVTTLKPVLTVRGRVGLYTKQSIIYTPHKTNLVEE